MKTVSNGRRFLVFNSAFFRTVCDATKIMTNTHTILRNGLFKSNTKVRKTPTKSS
jgi:hypothetical protein